MTTDRETPLGSGSTTGMWPPNPHSWWPTIIAAIFLVAVLYLV